MPPNTKHLLVVIGPTAVGKTALCIRLAQHLRTEIISADARQCYQQMAIGTAQPTPAEMQGVPHHLLNFLPVQAPYSAGRFARDALKILTKLFEHQDCVLMTGGSGLYIQAVHPGLDAMPSVPNAIRHTLNNQMQTQGLDGLLAMLATLDPVHYQRVDRANPQRVIRALEICLATGQPYTAFRKKQLAVRPFQTTLLGLTRDRQVLYQRIDQRVDQMWAQGLLREVIALYPDRHYNALQTVGYRELFDHLEGHYDQTEAMELIKRNTRRYAKKQLSWWRQDPTIRWFHPDDWSAIVQHVDTVVSAS